MAPVISVPLDQVSRSRTRAGSNQRTFPAAGQRPNNSSHSASDERSFASAVVRTAVVASLSTDTYTSKRSEYENYAKKRGQHTFVSTNPDHFITPRFKRHCACLFSL